jgi:hypothetical protein
MNVTGKNAGYSAWEMGQFEKQLRKTGIAMIESRETLSRMAQAQLDLTKTSQLARVAQDAAVIGGINSSAAFERMVHGIQSGQVETLRTIGINVNFEESYKKLAKELGTTANNLDETQKATARMNGVIEYGTKIAGAYELSMGTAGKQLQSMKRYVDDLKVKFGEVFNESLTAIVFGFSGALKDANSEMDELSADRSLQEWGESLKLVLLGVGEALNSIAIAAKSAGVVAGHLSVQSSIRDTYNAKIKAAGGGAGFDVAAAHAKAARERDAALLEEKKQFDAALKQLNSGYGAVWRAGQVASAKRAEQRTQEQTRDSRYYANLLQIQRAYAKESIEIQQAAQKALADYYYPEGIKPESPAGGNTGINTSTNKGTGTDPRIAFMAGLRKEVETLGMGEEALRRYEAAKMKLTGTSKKLADQYITQITVFKEQQVAAQANNEAFDEAIAKQNQIDGALESSIKSVREWIEQQEYEVSLIGMTNNEREVAIRLRAMETAGIDTQTESYKKLAEQIAAAASDRRGMGILSGTQTAKTAEFMADVAAVDKLFFDAKIGAEQFAEGINAITGSAEKAVTQMDSFAENAAKNIQKSMADFLFNPFDNGLKGMLQGFGTMLQKMIAEAVAADLARRLFGGLSDGGKTGGSGWIGSALSWVGGLFGTGSANGNAFDSSGHKLSGFSAGGVASGPTSGYPVMMHGTEAILPLKRGPNGKLGVESNTGSARNTTIVVNVNGANNAPDVRRAAGQGAREALGMINGAKRYA